jgi:alpha-methylacyl-CoA racemase
MDTAVPTNEGPLSGLTVLEFAGLGPAPFCAMMLADLGARIIRIDKPGRPANPDDPILNQQDPVIGRGRESIQLDLKNTTHRTVAHKLMATSDVVLEGFRPGVMERLDLGPEQAHRINPGLIYARVTGWGQQGPQSKRAGHDINYIAASGVLHAIGGEKPAIPLNLMGDYAGGASMACIGILSSLHARGHGEQNIVLDIGMRAGSAYLMSHQYELLAKGAWTDARQANLLDGAMPYYDTYRCADGRYIAVGAIEDKFYAELIAALDLDNEAAGIDRHDPADHPRLRALLAERFGQHSRAAWAAHFEDLDACVAPVVSMTELIEDSKSSTTPQLRERVPGIWEPRPAPESSMASQPAKPAPELGQDTAAILAQLDLPTDFLD